MTTHPTHRAAEVAAVRDLLDRLQRDRTAAPVSGRHHYAEEVIDGWVLVWLDGATTMVGECDTDDDAPSWRTIDNADRADPGWPIVEERAAWDLWLDGADVD